MQTIVSAVLALACATLCGCAAAPRTEVETVQVDAKKISLAHSSFSANVVSDAGDVRQTFAASLDPNVAASTVTRLESNFTKSVGTSEERLRVGDAVSSVGMWGSSVRFGGMQFGTRNDMRADVVASSEMATTGIAVLPTVADALFASIGANSESLAAQNLSVKRSTRGALSGNGLGLTAKDALGRSQVIDAPMISSTRLVESGCEDFSVGFGKVRRDYAITSNGYGPTFANTTVACGAPLGFTVEGHGEYLSNEVTAFGVGLARKVGPLGTASFAVAQSHADAGSGWLARVGLEHRNPWFNVALRSRLQSREFREIHSIALADPVMQRDLASIGVNVTKSANLSLSYATQTTWLRERANLIALRQSMNLGVGSLSMSAGHSMADTAGASFFISYQRPFGTPRKARSPVEEFDLDLLAQPLGSTSIQ